MGPEEGLSKKHLNTRVMTVLSEDQNMSDIGDWLCLGNVVKLDNVVIGNTQKNENIEYIHIKKYNMIL